MENRRVRERPANEHRFHLRRGLAGASPRQGPQACRWICADCKYIKITVILVGLVAGAVAQAPKKTISPRPNLRESFAKAGLKALLAIGDFKGTGSLTGPAQDAYEDARVTVNSTRAPETLMFANLRDLAIMRSTDNLAREKIIVQLDKTPKDQELSAALVSIDKRESECLASLERAFRNRIAIPLPGMCAK
jgi:hypothetical protein